ncbi:MAG: O-antigen ligase family protein [Pseudomonadota bacterium]
MMASLAGFMYACIGCAIAVGLLLFVFRDMFSRSEVFGLATLFIFASAAFFISPNALVFFAFLTVIILASAQRIDPMVLALFLMVTLPAPGLPFLPLPGVNYLINLTVPLLLGILLLTPAFFRRGGGHLKGAGTVDALVLAIVVGIFFLDFRNTTFTNDLRTGVQNLLTLGVAYFAFSRVIRTREALEQVVRGFVIAMLIAGCVGIICQVIYWNMYSYKVAKLFDAGIEAKSRGTLLRVTSTFGYAYINYGLVLMCATLAAVPWALRLKSRLFQAGFIVLMIFAVFMTASRGPFLAGIVGAFILILALRNSFSRLFIAGMVVVAVGIAASFTETGQGIIAYLPFIGEQDTEDYRVRLTQVSWPVVMDKPLTGDPFFRERPEMQTLIQGEGIIDVVNSYLSKALSYGLPIAGLFAAAHILAGFLAFRTARRVDPDDGWWRLLGASLAGAMACYASGIATTSLRYQTEEIGFILIGLCVAYTRISWAYGYAKSKRAQRADAVPVYGNQEYA